MQEIDLPDSLRHIGDNAFYHTAYLNGMGTGGAVYIGNHLIEVSPDYNAPGFIVKDGTVCIADNALECTAGRGKFTQITFPASLKAIGADACKGRDNITRATIKDIAAWCELEIGNEASTPLFYGKTTLYSGASAIRDLRARRSDEGRPLCLLRRERAAQRKAPLDDGRDRGERL